MAIAATPPTTPPTIAPVCEWPVAGGEDVRYPVGDVLKGVDTPGPIIEPGPISGESFFYKKKVDVTVNRSKAGGKDRTMLTTDLVCLVGDPVVHELEWVVITVP